MHDPKPKPFKERPIAFLEKDVYPLRVELAAGLQGLFHKPFPHPPILELGVDTHAVNQEIASGTSDHGQEAHQSAVQPGAGVESVLLKNLFEIPLRRLSHCMTEGHKFLRGDRQVFANRYFPALPLFFPVFHDGCQSTSPKGVFPRVRLRNPSYSFLEFPTVISVPCPGRRVISLGRV